VGVAVGAAGAHDPQLHNDVPIWYSELEHAHRSKALAPMLVTESGITTDDRLVQRSKADAPMLVTVSGIAADARLQQL
jgi:hypothetical protein